MAHPKPIRVTAARPSLIATARKLRISKADRLKVVLLNQIYSEMGRKGRRANNRLFSQADIKDIKATLAKRLRAARRAGATSLQAETTIE
jgi:hypothetical protein